MSRSTKRFVYKKYKCLHKPTLFGSTIRKIFIYLLQSEDASRELNNGKNDKGNNRKLGKYKRKPKMFG